MNPERTVAANSDQKAASLQTQDSIGNISCIAPVVRDDTRLSGDLSRHAIVIAHRDHLYPQSPPYEGYLDLLSTVHGRR